MFAVGGWTIASRKFRHRHRDTDRSARLIVEMPELSTHGATLRRAGFKDSYRPVACRTAPFFSE